MAERDLARVPGDVRKRLVELAAAVDAELPPNHDEVHGHADIDWNIVLGED